MVDLTDSLHEKLVCKSSNKINGIAITTINRFINIPEGLSILELSVSADGPEDIMLCSVKITI